MAIALVSSSMASRQRPWLSAAAAASKYCRATAISALVGSPARAGVAKVAASRRMQVR